MTTTEVLEKYAGTTETTEIEVSFSGYSSGDCECFCFAVLLEDYNRLCKKAGISADYPSADRFHDGMFRFYPDSLLYERVDPSKMYRFRIVIEAEPISDESQKQAGNPPMA